MKNSKKLLVIATLMGALATNQAIYPVPDDLEGWLALYARREAEYARRESEATSQTSAASVAQNEDRMLSAYMANFGKEMGTLHDELTKLQELIPQKLTDNEREDISKRLSKLQENTDNLLKQMPISKDVERGTVGEVLRHLISDAISKFSAAIFNTKDLNMLWKHENSKVEKQFIFGPEILYAASEKPVRIPQGATFSVRIPEDFSDHSAFSNSPVTTDALKMIYSNYITSGKTNGTGTMIFNIKATQKGPAYIFFPRVRSLSGSLTQKDVFNKPLMGYFAQFTVE